VSGSGLVEALAVALLLAFAEEVLFRGYLFGVLREELGRPRAYLLGNALFALVHLLRPGALVFKLAYGLGLFLVGAVLCQLAEARGTLWPGIGLHAGWIVMVVLDPPGRVAPGWLAGLGGDPAAGFLGWLLLLVLGVLVRGPRPWRAAC
jgi:membrane protease YdiL (CAAX protease family)